MLMKRIKRGLVLLFSVCTLLIEPSHAQQQTDGNSNLDDSQSAEVDAGYFGIQEENIDLRTGSIYWEISDIKLPGTAALDMEVARSWNKSDFSSHRALGNWELEVPRVQQTVKPTAPEKGGFCSNPYSAEFTPVTYTPKSYYEGGTEYVCSLQYVYNPQTKTSSFENVCGWVDTGHWVHPSPVTVGGYVNWFSGMSLIIPGSSPKPLLLRTSTTFPSTAKYVTADNWIVKCIKSVGSNEYNGYQVTSPQGTTYTMDIIGIEKGDGNSAWKNIYPQSLIWEYGPGDTFGSGYAAQITAFTSKIQDKFGNTINYTFDLISSANGRWGSSLVKPLLKKMQSNDGRLIEFEYNNDSISYINKITANGKEWVYDYSADRKYLASVILPDNSSWEYIYAGPNFSKVSPSILNVDYLKDRQYLSKVITPLGLNIEYKYTKADTDYFSLKGAGRFQEKLSVLSNRIMTAEDIAPNQVGFIYSKANDRNVTTITGDRSEKHEFSRDSKLLGAPVKSTIYSANGTILENMTQQWIAGQKLGESGFPYGPHKETAEYQRLLTMVKSNRDRADLTTFAHQRSYSGHDGFGRPHRIIENGTLYRRMDISYFDKNTYDTNGKWINGLMEDVSVYDNSSSTPVLAGSIDRSYDDDGRLVAISNFGINQNYEYYANGELKKQKFKQGAQGETIEVEYQNYKYGTPQLELYPEGVSIIRVVDTFGRVASQTDADGVTTTSTYNGIGKVSSISVSGEAIKSIDWVSPKVQRITKNNYRENNTHDSMGRLVLTEKYDADNQSQKIYVKTTYDKYGNIVFESYPSYSPSETRGVATEYDRLARRTKLINTVNNAETRYFYGNQWNSQKLTGDPDVGSIGFGVIDARGYKTIYKLDAFGSPKDTLPKETHEQVSWYAPTSYNNGVVTFPGTENKYIQTSYVNNVLGNRKSVTQGGITRSFTYYPSKPNLLHTVVHPETGTTTYTYDEAGNKKSQQVGASPVTQYKYDKNNRLTLVDYSGATNDTAMKYYPSGKLKSIDNELTKWAYTYNQAGKLETETLTLIGGSFELKYGYNAAGNRSSVRYPNGEIIELNPDALGRARKVGRYVSNVLYHPNGHIASYKYRNGHTTIITQNNKGQIEQIRSGLGSAYSMNQKYNYDNNDNVLRQENLLNASHTIEMGYDGLSRLVGANSSSWTGVTRRFEYDDVGNILRRTAGSNITTYAYNTSKNLLQSTSDGFSFSYDLQGNVTGNGKNIFIYDEANRLVSVGNKPSIEYTYDGHGHLTHTNKNKNNVINEIFSGYDKAGTLLFRMDTTTGYTTNYFYLGHRLVASNLDCSIRDTDGDSIPDCVEDAWGLNKLDASDGTADLDNDGVSNIYEYAFGLNPKKSDTDGNGLSDLYEIQNNIAGMYSSDSDSDGLSDYNEFIAKSNPLKKDTDGDGLLDGEDSMPTLNQGVLVVIIRSVLQ